LDEAGHPIKVYVNAAINGFLVLMILWSLLATYFTDPGYVKNLIISNCVSSREDDRTYEVYLKGLNQPFLTRVTISGSSHAFRDASDSIRGDAFKQFRFCEKCQIVKPPRCHHCSICD